VGIRSWAVRGAIEFRDVVYRIAANYALTACASGRRKKRGGKRRERKAGRHGKRSAQSRSLWGANAGTVARRAIELRKQMEQALAALSDAERTAFVMRHWEGWRDRRNRRSLEIKFQRDKNTVFRAVQKLRRALQPVVETRAQARAMERNHETHDGRRIDCVSRGSSEQRAVISGHLAVCEECRGEWHESSQYSQRWIRFLYRIRGRITGAGVREMRRGLRRNRRVAGVDGTTAAHCGRRDCGADCRGVCRRANHKARQNDENIANKEQVRRARAGGRRRRTPGHSERML